jgi:hypothetical protein
MAWTEQLNFKTTSTKPPRRREKKATNMGWLIAFYLYGAGALLAYKITPSRRVAVLWPVFVPYYFLPAFWRALTRQQ